MGTDRTDRESGFTLVELMIVMLIIGILSAIAFPAYASQSRKARLSALRSTLRNAATAEEAVATDNAGAYAPAGAAGLDALRAQGLRIPDSVTLEVIDDDMSLSGHGFCLHAVSTTHPDDELWFASSGSESGAPTTTACVAT